MVLANLVNTHLSKQTHLGQSLSAGWGRHQACLTILLWFGKVCMRLEREGGLKGGTQQTCTWTTVHMRLQREGGLQIKIQQTCTWTTVHMRLQREGGLQIKNSSKPAHKQQCACKLRERGWFTGRNPANLHINNSAHATWERERVVYRDESSKPAHEQQCTCDFRERMVYR